MLKDFKEFAMRGNVVDMAVGIIIGAAWDHYQFARFGRDHAAHWSIVREYRFL